MRRVPPSTPDTQSSPGRLYPPKCPEWCDGDTWHSEEGLAERVVTHSGFIAGGFWPQIRRAAPYRDAVTRENQGAWEIGIFADEDRTAVTTAKDTVVKVTVRRSGGTSIELDLLPGEALELGLALQRAAEREMFALIGH